MKQISGLVIVSLVGLLSCTHSAYKVTNSPADGGVPFLPIESVDVTKTVYEQVWMEVRVDGVFKKAPSKSHPPPAATKPKAGEKTDINSASEQEIASIPELKDHAKKIVASRPYAALQDLVERHVLSQAVLTKVQGKLTVTPGAAPPDPADDTFTTTVVGYTGDFKLEPKNREVALDMYRTFAQENGDLVKAWSETALEILGAKEKWKLTEPELLTDAELVETRRVAIECTRSQAPAARPQYFQVITPYGGSVNAGVELAPNGTMTKASSQVQDLLPGVVTTTVGSIVTAALGSGALTTLAAHRWAPAAEPAPVAEAVGEPIALKVDLKLTAVRRLYTVTIVRPSAGQVAADALRSLTVELQRGDDAKSDKPKDGSDAEAISIIGTIKLPKPAADGANTKEAKKE